MKKFLILFFFVLAILKGFGQEPDFQFSVNWERQEIHAAVSLHLASMGIGLPMGRTRGEERIAAEYPRLIRPRLLAVPVDSSATLGDLIDRGELPLSAPAEIALSAQRIPPTLSPDLESMSARYTISLNTLGAALLRHRRPAEIDRTLIPVPAASYTGIIIIANEELPLHGRNTRALPLPCLFPKIWDTEMNLIYERNTVEAEIGQSRGMIRYVSEGAIFRPTPSGLEGDLADLVGPNPLRIIAREVFGSRPTDPVIDRADALLIIATEGNRRLLREGRVVLVLHEKALVE
ncbi:MAG: polymerase [Spirochaetaceae bacterium]|jgi:hypothetical protein|nr:polymerase [Spirochaetaceae bacterium]